MDATSDLSSNAPSIISVGLKFCTLLFSADPAQLEPGHLPNDSTVLRYPYSDYTDVPHGIRGHHATRVFAHKKMISNPQIPLLYALIELVDCPECQKFQQELDIQERNIRNAGLLKRRCSEDDAGSKDLKDRIKMFENSVDNCKSRYPYRNLHARIAWVHHDVVKLMDERMEAAVVGRKWVTAKDYFGLMEDIGPYVLPSVEARVKELRAVDALSDELWGDDEANAEILAPDVLN